MYSYYPTTSYPVALPTIHFLHRRDLTILNSSAAGTRIMMRGNEPNERGEKWKRLPVIRKATSLFCCSCRALLLPE